MTTIKTMKFTCPNCKRNFQGQIAGSFGSRGVDENFCREYWGYNPMLSFLTMCPHCEHIASPFEYDLTEVEAEEDLLDAQETCETYVKLAEKLIDNNANPFDIASLFHQGACCRKLQVEDPIALFRKAN
jgi:uncharacterized protein (DUF2225 family)